MFEAIFLSHPRSVGESYWEHAATAGSFGGTMVVGGFACLIHAIIPILFTRTASNRVKMLYGLMKTRQPSLANQPPSYTWPEWNVEYEI